MTVIAGGQSSNLGMPKRRTQKDCKSLALASAHADDEKAAAESLLELLLQNTPRIGY